MSHTQVNSVARGLWYALPPRRGAQARQLWALLLSLRWGMQVSVLSGPAEPTGQVARVVLAGAEAPVADVLRRILRQPWQRQPISRVPVWRLLRTLEPLRGQADLVIAHIDTISARLLHREDWLRVPGLVDMWMSVQTDVRALSRASHSLKQDLRLVRKNGLTWEISHASADLLPFYRAFYLPSIHHRHGPMAYRQDLGFLRSCFTRGGLLWVMRGGQRVAGMLFDRRGAVMRVVASGTESGSWQLARGGAASAGYYFIWRHALDLGCSHINFGGCHAQLTDGLLLYKRKWGMSVVPRPDTYYDLLVSWARGGPAALEFLGTAPIVHHGGRKLSAVAAVGSDGRGTLDDAMAAYRSLWTPGLHELRLVSPGGWQPRIAAPTETVLLNWNAVCDGGPRRLLSQQHALDQCAGVETHAELSR